MQESWTRRQVLQRGGTAAVGVAGLAGLAGYPWPHRTRPLTRTRPPTRPPPAPLRPPALPQPGRRAQRRPRLLRDQKRPAPPGGLGHPGRRRGPGALPVPRAPRLRGQVRRGLRPHDRGPGRPAGLVRVADQPTPRRTSPARCTAASRCSPGGAGRRRDLRAGDLLHRRLLVHRDRYRQGRPRAGGRPARVQPHRSGHRADHRIPAAERGPVGHRRQARRRGPGPASSRRSTSRPGTWSSSGRASTTCRSPNPSSRSPAAPPTSRSTTSTSTRSTWRPTGTCSSRPATPGRSTISAATTARSAGGWAGRNQISPSGPARSSPGSTISAPTARTCSRCSTTPPHRPRNRSHAACCWTWIPRART